MTVVLTYDAPHRKTQDLLLRLKAIGKKDICVAATPWVERKNFEPLIPHRPGNPISVALKDFCGHLGYRWDAIQPENISRFLESRRAEFVLIAGAGVLPGEVIGKRTVINAHPGYLPIVRGLDALKWAVYEGLTVGVTTHVVSEETDAGNLIRREAVPIYASDTFHSLAYRQYEMEIQMLADAMEDYKKLKKPLLSLRTSEYPVRRRMPHALERELLSKFEGIIRNVPLHSS